MNQKKPHEENYEKLTQRFSDTKQTTVEQLRTIVESANINFLIGAGTSSGFFPALGNVEESLTQLEEEGCSEDVRTLVRASIQAYFFDKVISPNSKILTEDIKKLNEVERKVLNSYKSFIRTLNRILLFRRNSILSKQVNIFTTNVDMLFEVAMEQTGVEYSDGFNGKIKPKFDFGDFGTLRFRTSARYDNRFEVPVFNLVKIHGSAAWHQHENEELESKERKTEIYFDHRLTLVSEIKKQMSAADPYLIAEKCLLKKEGEESAPPEIESIDKLVKKAKEKQKNEAYQLSEVRGFAAAYDRLGIINPDKRKFATTVLNETYYELIRRFANELEKENSVLFVHGFSFRDEHIRNIVLRAARTNPTLQVIVFCYSSAAGKDYAKLLPEIEIKNGNIDLVPPKKDEGEKELNISLDRLESDYFAPIVVDELA